MSSRFNKYVDIGSHKLGPGCDPLIVAEIGGNHNGDVALARALIDAAARAGVAAVKFQTYQTLSFLTRSSPYYDELAGEELNLAEQAELCTYARARGLMFLTTVFDERAVEFADWLNLPALKISSGDLTNRPLIEAAASLGRPLVISTGAAEKEEVGLALDWAEAAGARSVVLLQCTSLYPCPDDVVNLAAIAGMAEHYGLPVGYSDHTPGSGNPPGRGCPGSGAGGKALHHRPQPAGRG